VKVADGTLDGQKNRLGNEDARLKDEIIEQEQRLKPKYGESGPGVRCKSRKVVVRRAKPTRVEDNVVSGCSIGLDCHFVH
jgi:hypothetical protein